MITHGVKSYLSSMIKHIYDKVSKQQTHKACTGTNWLHKLNEHI